MFQTSKVLPYTANFLKEIVTDIERYPEFLPWIKAVASYPDNFFDLTIGYGIFEKTYRSEVFILSDAVEAKAVSDNIFKFLETRWHFKDYKNEQCMVNFTIDFQLQSPILQLTVGNLLDDSASKIITAFEQRAEKLHNY